MKRFHNASPYRVTLNYAFDRVIDGCANHRDEGTWITRGIEEAYRRLHELGHAHSIEVWRDRELVGGMYGVSQGGAVLRRIDVLAARRMPLKPHCWFFALNLPVTAVNLLIVRYLIVIPPRSAPLKFHVVTTSITSRPYANSRWPPVFGCRGHYFCPGSECFRHIFYWGVIIAAAELV
ncbi:leucyl/phenylalanyl-tRNA-protein transferase [Salmonella enterica subsp. enterica]|nr:leucyl/phenylalanyl-tRNA-protein transferase [Salmonella enterica subsp. enterica]